MATPRLPFLYPNLTRAVRSCEPTTYRSIRLSASRHRCPRGAPLKAEFHTSWSHRQETYHRRYGPAAEPTLPPPSKPKEGGVGQQQPGVAGKSTRGKRKDEYTERQQPSVYSKSSVNPENPPATSERQVSTSASAGPESQSENLNPEMEDDGLVDFTPVEGAARDEGKQTSEASSSDNPLEEVLHMPSPSSSLTPSVTSSTDPSNKPIHLTPGRYVHHFDTYSLVQDLSRGGFTNEQSVTIMKAIRHILRNNLTVARESLVSKSDVENESYLFKAACSELQSSLQTARNAEIQRQRSSRTQLQHEEDIISQRLNQELAGLKDDIKGMFNDHKMTTRELQRSINTSIQELNYKITVSLNSDGKSAIEGLRWILTRRAAMAIATSAFMIILFLKYYSIRRSQVAAQKAKEEALAKESAEARATKTVNEMSLSDLSESLG
ncbi:hypothetical protein MPDQ_001674 [Monascus purpureus]|uniref:MOZ protein represents a chromatin-associated acetyltransferase n=1 Tax=Monascus purpureus TaxID=5098 RepID=A0A507QQQ7_MONPU|nr:hypothetical protein MPDQ_001674 [Monascus purpureus]BDD61777.1 hypothetical protein MAP00_006802 [Monascus purpureus]